MFEKCYGLTSIGVPSTVKNIDNHAFNECINLESIALHDGLTKIAYAAFADCSSLTSIAIPESVSDIESDVFYGCCALIEMFMPGMTCEFVKDHAIDWSIGVDFRPYMQGQTLKVHEVIVHCKDGMIVINEDIEGDDSSSSDSNNS